MPTQSLRSRRAVIVATCPLILVTALLLHPFLSGRQPNVHALGEAVASDPTRWGLVHLATGIGSAVMALGFIAIRNHLHEAGETRWSSRGLPLAVVGSTLYAMLPAMEFAPLAAVESGGDPAAAQQALLELVRARARPQRDLVRSGDGLLRAQRGRQPGRGSRPRPPHRSVARRPRDLTRRALRRRPVLRAEHRGLRRNAAPRLCHEAADFVPHGIRPRK